MSTRYGGDSGARVHFPASSVQRGAADTEAYPVVGRGDPDGHSQVEEPLLSSPTYFPGQEQLSQPLFSEDSSLPRPPIGEGFSGPAISGNEAQRLDEPSNQNGTVNSSRQGVLTLTFDA